MISRSSSCNTQVRSEFFNYYGKCSVSRLLKITYLFCGKPELPVMICRKVNCIQHTTCNCCNTAEEQLNHPLEKQRWGEEMSQKIIHHHINRLAFCTAYLSDINSNQRLHTHSAALLKYCFGHINTRPLKYSEKALQNMCQATNLKFLKSRFKCFKILTLSFNVIGHTLIVVIPNYII